MSPIKHHVNGMVMILLTNYKENTMNKKKLENLLYAAKDIGFDSISIVHKDKFVLSAYNYPYTKDKPHVMYSATKSFISTLAGILIHEGKLSLDDKVLSFFPEITPNNPSKNKSEMTLKHLLTMTTGHKVDSTASLYNAGDKTWVQVFLDQTVPLKPGTTFVYDSGASYMIGAIINKVINIDVLDFAKERLLDPLGITNFHWQKCPQGIAIGGWGLYLTTEDMLKFGQLFLHNGKWNGRQLVASWWVLEATKKHISTPDEEDDLGYGFQWWMTPSGYCAAGMGGQKIFVAPELDLVVAITMSGIEDSNNMPDTMMNDFIIPAVKEENDDSNHSLETVICELESAPCKKPYILSPNLNEIIGKKYTFEKNALKSLELMQDGECGVLTLQWKDMFNHSHKESFPFCLDGTYGIKKSSSSSLLPMLHYSDCHTKAVFKGDRVIEFSMQIPGELFRVNWSLNFSGDEIIFTTLYQSMEHMPRFMAKTGK